MQDAQKKRPRGEQPERPRIFQISVKLTAANVVRFARNRNSGAVETYERFDMPYAHPNYEADRRANALQAEQLRWAVAYAANGYPVFPCDRQKKSHVRWKAAASTDRRQIENWWRKWPLAMIGVPMGSRSGLVVLDVDCKNGVDGFATMRASDWTIPPGTIEVRTPSGGAHFYFRYTGTERNSAGKIGPGLDIRGEGGYVIVPPSRPSLDGPDYCYAEGQEIEMGVLA